MDADLALILGLVMIALSIPSLVSAFSDRHPPVIPGTMLFGGGVLVALAVVIHPGGYAISDIPHVFFGVVARFWP